MQTLKIKPKQPKQRKQHAIALATALTLALTLILQLFAPITAHAEETEEEKTPLYSDVFAHVENKQYREGDVDYEVYYDYTVTANIPYKMVLMKCEQTTSDSYWTDYYVYFLFDNVDGLSMSYYCDVENIGADSNEIASSGNYTSTSAHSITNSDGSTSYYIGAFAFVSYEHSEDGYYYPWYATVDIKGYDYYIDKPYEGGDSPLQAEEREVILKDIVDGKYKQELNFDESTATYNVDIPTPKLTVNSDYSFGFNNASDDYYFQLKGRWYSVDDIELYKENLQWKYKYNSIIKSNLTEWVTTGDKLLTSTSNLNLATFGQTAFNLFLSTWSVDNRYYSGGTNSVGNYFSGYSDALSTLKMLLAQPTSIYNGLEIYVRYYTFDDNGIAHYGKWCHYYDNLASVSGSTGSQWDDSKNMFTGNQSSSGLDDEQFTDVENMQDSRNDVDLQPEYNDTGYGSIILDDIDTTSLTNSLQSMYEQTKTFINMFGTVFNFLPPWVIALVCASLGVICIIGIWKCIRG